MLASSSNFLLLRAIAADVSLSIPNSPFDGQLNGRASLMTDHPKKVIYDFYFQTADAKSPIASVKIKASISERPLNASTRYLYWCIGVALARNKLITSVFGTRMSSVPPTNSKFLYKLEACLPRILPSERLCSHCLSLCIQSRADLRATLTQIRSNRI